MSISIRTIAIRPEASLFYEKEIAKAKDFAPIELLEWFCGMDYLYDTRNHSLIGAQKLEEALVKEYWGSVEHCGHYYEGYATERALTKGWDCIQRPEDNTGIDNLEFFYSVYKSVFPEEAGF